MTHRETKRQAARCASFVALTILVVPFTSRGAESAVASEEAPAAAKPAEIPQPLPGQLSSKFAIDESNPEASVPSTKDRDKDPLEYGYFIQDLLTRAEQAQKKHDYKTVVLFYRAVARAVPENAKGWSKLCEAYEVVGDRDRAIRACKYALERPAVELQDYTRYVRLIIGKTERLTSEEVSAVKEVLVHLDKQPDIVGAAAQLKCEVGVKASDLPLLEACTTTLAKLAPEDPKTIVFQWNLAVQKGQHADAQRLVERAKKAGVVMANIERMQKVTNSSTGRTWFRGAGIGAAALAVSALAALMWHLRRRRLVTQRYAP